jgi:endoglucanase
MKLLMLIATVGLIVGAAAPPALAQSQQAPPRTSAVSPFRTSGAQIVDANGNEVRITGVNWFGLETSNFAPHGLWSRGLGEMLDQIAASGFNTIRLPYTNQLFDPASKPTGIDFQKNPTMQNLTGPQVMDAVVTEAGKRGLKIILDRHRPTAEAQSDLWYTDRVSEDKWIQDWVSLASHYAGDDTVIGADLHNEPRGAATWGDGNPQTDWRLAATRAGNAILAANPNWLIFVEGIEHTGDDWYWWGGNLANAGQAPIELAVPNHLVYSAHDYGPGVYLQKWFGVVDFPYNLSQVWGAHWAYLAQNNTAPVLIGEFGGRSVGGDKEGVWQRTLVSFLKDSGISYTYWSWNPNSGDTGGLLMDDWTTPDTAKLQVLQTYQWPLLGNASATQGSGQ